MKPITEYRQFLSANDRRALVILLAVIACFSVLALVKISCDYYIAGKQRFAEASSLLAWMHDNKGAVERRPSVPEASSERNLLRTLTTTAQSAGITLDRVQPGSESSVRLWLQEVEFAALLPWLSALSEKEVKIASVAIDRTPDPGEVSVQLLLEN